MNQLLRICHRWSLLAHVGLNLNMKTRPLLSMAVALVVAACGGGQAAAAEDDGVALAIIYDTSGSMKDTVRDRAGDYAPKYQIANRALIAVARQIEAFATNKATGPRTIHAALFTFEGDHAREVVRFGPFDAAALEQFARRFSNPNGNTPLGNSLNTAAKTVLDSPLPRKHVLVITDGVNTIGPRPEAVLPRVKQQAAEKQAALSVHFVAFDVAAKQFDPLKRQGATVVGAADEKQLNSQLQFILQRKILLEDEELPQKK